MFPRSTARPWLMVIISSAPIMVEIDGQPIQTGPVLNKLSKGTGCALDSLSGGYICSGGCFRSSYAQWKCAASVRQKVLVPRCPYLRVPQYGNGFNELTMLQLTASDTLLQKLQGSRSLSR